MDINKVRLFLYSARNITGCVLALGGLALYFDGIIHPYWWAIVAGLYGAGALAWPRNTIAEQVESAELSGDSLAHQVKKLVDSVVAHLPRPAVESLRRIQNTLAELLPRLQQLRERGVISSRDAFTVTETVRRYLPDTLGAYLRLPRLYAQMQPLADGKTATQTLLMQLEMLETSLRDISQSAFEGDAQTLIANGRFLQDRFAERPAFRA